MPDLRAVYDLARAVRDDGTEPWFCANYLWYRTLKPILVSLVGYGARWEVYEDGQPRLRVKTLDEYLAEFPKWEIEPMWAMPEDVAILRSRWAYAVAYKTLYDALPACRDV